MPEYLLTSAVHKIDLKQRTKTAPRLTSGAAVETEAGMNWTRSDTLALAAPQCTQCDGLGLRGGSLSSHEPCNCVLRAIFRICYARFQQCMLEEKYLKRTNLEVVPGRAPRRFWGRKEEEFAADFCLVSRRYLSAPEYRIFKYHFLLGADWRLCCRKLALDRGIFFHAVYRIQQKLGRLFRELEPYNLFPLGDYFGTTMKTVKALMPAERTVLPIRPPVRRKPDYPVDLPISA